MSFSDIAIRIEDVSKRYELYDTPRDRLKQFVMPRFQRMLGLIPKFYFREFHALTNISFQIKRGETVGIIGRNGSGKSTLLQILCGTLSPSNGKVEINGRVAALLELGAGFNPEFTGRENVYLNASILGLSKGDIDARFNDIVAFADIGYFIEQPVKVYSSGMYVRLAFAVIAHVNADILIIDEALAVGDAIFTQKCMHFLRNFMKNGTVLFVSHDTPSVKNLCTRALWLERGQVLKDGNPKDVCDRYYQYTLQGIYGDDIKLNTLSCENIAKVAEQEKTPSEEEPAIDYESKISITDNSALSTGWKTGAAEVISVSMEPIDHKSNNIFEGGERVRVIMRAKTLSILTSPILGFIVKDRLGQELFGENTIPFTKNNPLHAKTGQELIAEFVFRLPMLQDGQYAVMTSLANGDSYNHIQHHYVHDALIINVHSSKIRFGIVGVPFESVSLKISNQIS